MDEQKPPVVAVRGGRRTHLAYVGVMLALAAGLVVYDGVRRTGTGAALLVVQDPPPPPAGGGGNATTERAVLPSTRGVGRLRVATFNMASGVGRDDVRDLARTARTIRDAGAQAGGGAGGMFDVVALHEVRGDWGSGGGQAEELAVRLTMRWVFGASERRWWHDDFGNAMLIGGAIEGDGVLRVPMPQTQERGWRNVLVVRVPVVGGGDVSVLGTHVDRQRDQSAQLRFLRQLFLATPAPAVLMADFNVTREHPIIREMMDKDGVIEATESVNGGGKIEMVLAKGLRAVNAGRLDEGASDHPIVWAELEVESGRGGRE